MSKFSLFTCLLFCSLWATAAPADSLIIRFGNKGRVVIYASTKDQLKRITNYDLNRIVKDMVMKLDSVSEGQIYAVDVPDDKRYLRDTLVMVRKSRGKLTVTIKGNDADTTGNSERQVRAGRESNKSIRGNWRISTDFHIGLNTWLGNSAVSTYGKGSYELNPLGSRYFAISVTQNPAIIRTSRFRLSLRYGVQVAWNNFMFQEDTRLERGPDAVSFNNYPTPLDKSKLTVCSVEIPLIPQFSIYNSSRKRAFNVGVGGFVGYRVDSYTKIKQEDGGKVRDHNNFFTNNLQYGIQGNVGLVNVNFFLKYHVNTTFQENRGPTVHPFSFGISI